VVIPYARHRALIERMYEDTATICRYDDDKNPVTKETELTLYEVYSNQPCKLSQLRLPQDGQTEAQNDVRYDAKLFIAPDVEVQQGDVVSVTRAATGRVETYVAGKPFPPYQSHQEINLTQKGYA
jgi:hypothetical protein